MAVVTAEKEMNEKRETTVGQHRDSSGWKLENGANM
jgi:hypothetical protein